MAMVSGVQLGALQQKGLNSPYSLADEDNEHSLGDPMGGWKGPEGPDPHTKDNLTTGGKTLAWRSNPRASHNSRTYGTFLNLATPDWHERYNRDS